MFLTDDADYGPQHALLDDFVRGRLRAEAERNLERYFADPADERGGYTGRWFERFAGGGDQAGELTAADVLALSLLSVERRLGRVAIALLEVRADEINGLLGQIPDIALHEVSAGAKTGTIGPGSPAWKLWQVVDTAGGGHWPVTAYKLMARKRPALFPPFDTRVAHALGVRLRGFDLWDCLWQWFHHDPSRTGAVEDLRTAVGGISDISLLRCLDVALWLHCADPAARGT